jgi:hypothetical protein
LLERFIVPRPESFEVQRSRATLVDAAGHWQ